MKNVPDASHLLGLWPVFILLFARSSALCRTGRSIVRHGAAPRCDRNRARRQTAGPCALAAHSLMPRAVTTLDSLGVTLRPSPWLQCGHYRPKTSSRVSATS